MKPSVLRKLNHLGKQTIAGCCLVAIAVSGSWIAVAVGAPVSANKSVSPVKTKVNRTVPKVQPPKGGVQFSAKPTTEEIFRGRIFEEPLVPVGGQPSAEENAALASALVGYAKRSGPDDFGALTAFLDSHPRSAWRVALLTDLGLEYYNTAHYSLALDAWTQAWALSKDATDQKGKAIGDRAVGELAYMYARLGRMDDLEPLLNSVAGRMFVGPATEKISGARAGLSNMKDRPEIAFKCGPMALHRIKSSIDPKHAGDDIIHRAASTQKGLSLPQVAELSQKVGLNYQMAHRDAGASLIVPSVVHWKVGHYAALIRQQGDRYLIQDPTFQNDVWATKQVLEDESSGYFLVPPGNLKEGWHAVGAAEGSTIWGKGNVGDKDHKRTGHQDLLRPDPCIRKLEKGMAVSNVHLMLVSLNIEDEPVGYSPPVGPAVTFPITYNQREASQPTTFTYSNFGPKWTFDWISYITDNPLSPAADVNYFVMGGGTDTFTGFNSATQTFAPQQYGQARLTRTGPASYEMVSSDGSKEIFGQSDGSAGTSRKVFLTQLIDPFGNAVTITYDSNFRIVATTDAIGQVSTISYTNPNDIYKITKITDPFGRFATFDYDAFGRLVKITDVIGITSQFNYESTGDFINSLVTPYGTTAFTTGGSGTTVWLETLYPNGERDRVEFNQSTDLGTPVSVPAASVPAGMLTHNDFLWYRNTYYWSRNAYAAGYPDYTKAKVYHWLHTTDINVASGILESEKEALEGRVWYDYAGQSDGLIVGSTDKPTHVGRVLDDGTTQLDAYEYDDFGHVTKVIDPLGRTISRFYAPNSIDLLEVRQTRGGNNELLWQRTYNAQHLPLTEKDAAGQTTTYTYNARGQVLTMKNAKNETTTYTYDANGYWMSVDGPLPGPGDTETLTYDGFGRFHTTTDVSGYTLTFDYDPLDRLTKTTYPDSTFEQFTYTFLDLVQIRDRAGRLTTFEYSPIRQMSKRTDALNRATLFEWCKCGGLKTLTEPTGRTTTWRNDVQGRITSKNYSDGSKVSYVYENTTSRLRERTDEKLQVTRYSYNRDNTASTTNYVNTGLATPPVAFTYDPNYQRVTAMTDGYGTTRYAYVPITGAVSLGATHLDTVDGPLPNDTIKYGYDEFGRPVSRAINGVASSLVFDALGRVTGETNSLGTFSYSYDGNSQRLASQNYPNGQGLELAYGTNLQDRLLQRITHKLGATALSEFLYSRDIPLGGRITSWSQQAGTQTPSIYSFGYDAADQVTSANIVSGGPPNSFNYSYDLAGNRLTEGIDNTTSTASYNTLNQLTSLAGPTGNGITNEWDAEQRLAAVNVGNQRTEFSYDGLGRRVAIRKLVNGAEVSNRRFVWCDHEICEERDSAGAVTKRFFPQGMKSETGPGAGNYYYTRDHLGSIRELTDSSGVVRARYSYDPFGRRTKVAGDLEADFGFAGMFWTGEANLNLTLFRAYDPAIGRWLSRDPLHDAEIEQGPNLYLYVGNNPVNLTDSLGLACDNEAEIVVRTFKAVQGCLVANGANPLVHDYWRAGPCWKEWSEYGRASEALAKCVQDSHKPKCDSKDVNDPWCKSKPKVPPRPTPSPRPPKPQKPPPCS
jgi:RHS repeat-associated protein